MPHRIFVKIFFGIVILIVILSSVIYFFAKPILLSIVQKELHKISKESSIRDIKITTDHLEFQDIEIKEKNIYDLKIKEARVYYSLGAILKKKCSFCIKTIDCNELKIEEVAGNCRIERNILYISPVSVSFLGGRVKGELRISLNETMEYNLRLDTYGMEIKRFVDDMKFNEKFDMTGRLGGVFYLSGKGQGIKDIKGNFNTDTPGGLLVIKDKTFLENVAKQSNQSLDIIVESFRNYNYNNGMISFDIENNNLVMNMELDGKAGKRSLIIILHSFNKGEEKP
jgi:hypothetical protein